MPLVATFEVEEILPESVPQSAANGSWALLDLIACALTVLLALAKLLERREENEENAEAARYFGLLPALVSVILFVLHEDMRLPMVMTSVWTPVLLTLLVINGLLAVSSARRAARSES